MKKTIKQINDYKLIDNIKDSDNPNLFEAVNSKNEEKFAIYSLQKSIVNNEVAFQSSFSKFANFKHPYILSLAGYERTKNNYYFIYDFKNTIILKELLKNRKLSLKEISFIIRSLCIGIKYLSSIEDIVNNIETNEISVKLDSEGNCEEVKYLNFFFEKYCHKEKIGNGVTGIKLQDSETLQKLYKAQSIILSIGALTFELLTGIKPLILIENIDEFKNQLEKIGIKEIIACQEIIDFTNDIINFNSCKLTNLNDMLKHPFLAKDPSTFTNINVKVNLFNKVNHNENYLWKFFEIGPAKAVSNKNNIDKTIDFRLFNDSQIVVEAESCNNNEKSLKKNEIEQENRILKNQDFIQNEFNLLSDNEDNEISIDWELLTYSEFEIIGSSENVMIIDDFYRKS